MIAQILDFCYHFPMKKLSINDAEAQIVAIQDEIRRNDDARYDHRLHAVLLVVQGMSCHKVASMLGDAPRTVAYWVTRFKKDGFDGLTDAARPGRPCRLSSSQMEELEVVLRGEPSAYGLQGLWDGKTLGTFIDMKWNITLGVRQCQRIFRSMRFRLRKPRSKIAKADKVKQDEYKKKLQNTKKIITRSTSGH